MSDKQPGPLVGFDFDTAITIMRTYRTDMLPFFQDAFNERLNSMRSIIEECVDINNRDKVLINISNMMSSMASLAMIKYENASFRKNNNTLGQGKTRKAEMEKAITLGAAEKHRNTLTGKLPSSSSTALMQSVNAARKAHELKEIGGRQVRRHLRGEA